MGGGERRAWPGERMTPLRAFSRPLVGVIPVLALGAALLVVAMPASAAAPPHYVACIELTGQPLTKRDLKLREGPCKKNERRIVWPPGTAGPVGPTGPTGPTGAAGAAGAAGAETADFPL